MVFGAFPHADVRLARLLVSTSLMSPTAAPACGRLLLYV